MYDSELEKIAEKLNIFEKAYDIIRLVDPEKKKVIHLHDNQADNSPVQCFDFWGRNKICNNCISIRAYIDKKTYIKMEYNSGEIYMVTAAPIEVEGRTVVLEMMKNTTDSILLDSRDDNRYSEIHTLIDNMNNLAVKDKLTETFNRRYIEEKLPIDIANALISNTDLSIIMADIDFFKKVNDNYGHQAGDCALKQFAWLLSQNLSRKTDWAARYGGEEFLICLPGTDLTYASAVAEQMRISVENHVMECGDEKLKITASFGVSSLASEGMSMEELIKEADKKLYEAKHNGRNRVEK